MKNIAILAHVDAGKTSLTESFLSVCGKNLGSVDAGTTTTDSNEIEKRRGISIYTSTTSIHYKNEKINIIDTPGHMDFINEVEQALMVCDVAVLLIAANDQDIKVQTSRIYQKLMELKIPTVVFINKIDLPNADVEAQLHRLGVLTHGRSQDIYNQKALLDSLTLIDDSLLESVLSEKVDKQVIEKAMLSKTLESKFIPVLKGSATQLIGIQELLDVIVDLPSKSNNTSELSGLIYKKSYSEDNKLQVYIRLYGGKLKVKTRFLYQGEPLLLKHLYSLEDGSIHKVDTIENQDIAIVEGLDHLEIGTWIGQEDLVKIMPVWTQGHYKVCVKPKAGTRVELMNALNRMIHINPFIEMSIDTITQDINLFLVGVIQKEIVSATLKEEYGLEPEISEAQVIYKKRPNEVLVETVWMNTIENSNWATMRMRLDPLEIGSGFKYETLVNTGYLRQSFQNAIQESLEQCTHEVHNGLQVTDYKLTLEYAEFASPVSTPSDFRHATAVLYNKLMKDSTFDLLEPTGSFTLMVPNGAVKKAYQDLERFQAHINTTEYIDDNVEIQGEMPLKYGINYQTEVLAYTNGYGSFDVTPKSYQRATNGLKD